MQGYDVYRLSVYIRTHTNGGWKHLSDQIGEEENENLWYRATVPLSSDADFQVSTMVVNSACVQMVVRL